MHITKEVEVCRDICRERSRHGTTALVPTMGFLHEGHLSLIRIARAMAEFTAVSLFVNPTQFGPGEDYETYPRNFERDMELCRREGVDMLFCPSSSAMFPEDASVEIHEHTLSPGLCGASRPGHFNGVCTIVSKLFNIVAPDIAVFGEKDAQQLRVIRRMVRDLNIPVKIVSGPIIREIDGLAMSSRNVRLSKEDRRAALCLQAGLQACTDAVSQGENRVEVLSGYLKAPICAEPRARLDYAVIVDDQTLQPIGILQAPALAALAVHFGDVRLIDNARLIPA